MTSPSPSPTSAAWICRWSRSAVAVATALEPRGAWCADSWGTSTSVLPEPRAALALRLREETIVLQTPGRPLIRLRHPFDSHARSGQALLPSAEGRKDLGWVSSALSIETLLP